MDFSSSDDKILKKGKNISIKISRFLMIKYEKLSNIVLIVIRLEYTID